jgi:uncharacterized protein YydD (DUF2326 family)
MRLLKLSANKESFKTVEFNSNGLSIIVGKRHNNDYTQNKKGTYNSVGKSFTIALVHFCLGASRNPAFEEKLSEWEFSLDFEIDDELYTVTRKCNDQKNVILNGKTITNTEYTELLEKKVFSIPEESKNLTFRSLIPRFIRPKKSSYTSYDNFIDEETAYQQLVNNAFLLGLDVSYIIKKYDLKEELDTVETKRKAFENDPAIKNIFEQNEDDDLEIDLVDLKQKILKLEHDLSRFEVAADYYEVVKQADALKLEVKALENKAATYKTALANIEKSLHITPDVPKKRIEQLYSEAQVSIPYLIKKQLAEVEAFNRKLLDNRSERLLKEKVDFENKLAVVEDDIRRLGKEKDSKLEYLSSKGALDEFSKMNNQLNDYKAQYENIEKYRKLKLQYKNRTEELKREMSLENTRTTEYIEGIRNLIEQNILLFKELASEFYENKKAGIEIKPNDGVNKTRFNIKAKIDDDKGDGVNDVKIFCFDWTLLLGSHHHKVNFIFHDSRLLSEIDSRQQAALFNVALKYSMANNLQYIISVNQNTVDSLQKEMEEEQFKMIFNDKTVILELTDESVESKLLGIEVDIDYDKE